MDTAPSVRGEVIGRTTFQRTFGMVLTFLLLLTLVICGSSFAQTDVPLLEVDATALDFGDTEDSMSFTITNAGGGSLSWSLYEAVLWLSTDVTSGIVESGESATVTVVVDRKTVSTIGELTATITVLTEEDYATVLVSMLVPERPRLEVTPTALEFGRDEVVQQLAISNGGTGSLDWTIVTEESWLSVDQAAGAVESGGEIKVLVLVDRSAVASVGRYEGIASISSDGGDRSVLISMEKGNRSPNAPRAIAPADGMTGQSLYTTLRCQGSDGETEEGESTTYDVYFSSSEILVAVEDTSVLVCSEMTVCYCDPSAGGLKEGTTYYWKAVAKDTRGAVTPGAVWSFTTGTPGTTVCPALALGLDYENYRLLRRVRDEVLAQSEWGRDAIDTYYRCGYDLFVLFLIHDELQAEARAFLHELNPVLQSLLAGREARITGELLRGVATFLGKVSRLASPRTRAAVVGLENAIRNGVLLQGIGVVTVDQ